MTTTMDILAHVRVEAPEIDQVCVICATSLLEGVFSNRFMVGLEQSARHSRPQFAICSRTSPPDVPTVCSDRSRRAFLDDGPDLST